MSKKLLDQAANSIEFVQKLFFEISYLIKEVEGLLGQEDEKFIIGRPSGYHVTNRTSSGLEPLNVDIWLPKTFTVFFCREEDTTTKKGQTITPFASGLKILILDIALSNKQGIKPRIAAGCLWDIKSKRKDHTKFEYLMWEFAYNRHKIFANLPKINYEDSYMECQGEFVVKNLFDINDSESVVKKLVEPMLKIYRAK